MSEPACSCDAIVHPRIIVNPPALDVLDYRVGDYRSFRHALLRPLGGEIALAGWHPTATGDLALQLLEWWAYLADVLVFYNERALHELLLRTAVLPEDVRRIVRLLGYRPRPGIGATGVVAALTRATSRFVVPAGFAIEGVSAPGAPEQVFETDVDVTMGLLGQKLPKSARFPTPPGTADAPPPGLVTDDQGFLIDSTTVKTDGNTTHVEGGKEHTLVLSGVIASVKPDDMLLLLARDWDGLLPSRYALSTVKEIVHRNDLDGNAITTVTGVAGQTLPDAVSGSAYRVLRATKSAHLWLYHARYASSTELGAVETGLAVAAAAQAAESFFDPAHVFSGGESSTPPEDPRPLCGFSLTDGPIGVAHLEAITRGIAAGDPVLFEQRILGTSALVKVLGYTEEIWYANPPEGDRIGQGPPVGPPSGRLLGGGAAALPIPHSRLTFFNPIENFEVEAMTVDGTMLNSILVHYGWQEVAPIADAAPTGPVDSATPETSTDSPAGHPALVEDANGNGIPGFLGAPGTSIDQPLVPPLRALLNLLPVSRGKTVELEVVGSGDPILVRQELALARSPLTYLADTGPRSVNGYRSTLEIRVDGIEWTEVPSFYGQPPDARVFVTREDVQQQTYVRFGDGENGARLPAGVGNVVARYRVGSGADTPRPGSLTQILRPLAGLTEIRNPVPVGGGADPDPADQIRRYAPRSVLTFGRAVSGDDYETIAAQTPGVRRARATWIWDAAAQRTMVKVYVGDDAAAVEAARAAIAAFADPNRSVSVELASPLYPDLSLTVEVDPAFVADDVGAAVTTALLAPRAAPFGVEIAQIGAAVYDSEIYDACLRVPGVVAVHGLRFALWWRRRLSYFALGRLERAILRDPIDPYGTDPVSGAPIHRGGLLLLRPRLFTDWLATDTGERHLPGDGHVFLLRRDRLLVRSELARHVL